MLVMYVRNNKIRSMGNKEMEKKRKNVCDCFSPLPIAVNVRKKTKKSVHLFSFLLAECSKGERKQVVFFGSSWPD